MTARELVSSRASTGTKALSVVAAIESPSAGTPISTNLRSSPDGSFVEVGRLGRKLITSSSKEVVRNECNPHSTVPVVLPELGATCLPPAFARLVAPTVARARGHA